MSAHQPTHQPALELLHALLASSAHHAAIDASAARANEGDAVEAVDAALEALLHLAEGRGKVPAPRVAGASAPGEALHREFHLTSPRAQIALHRFIDANVEGCRSRGQALRVVVSNEKARRRSEQNRHYWGELLTRLAREAWVDGRRYTPDAWHEYLARRLGSVETLELPNGETLCRRKSTRAMGVAEFARYLARVEAYAWAELGLDLGASPDTPSPAADLGSMPSGGTKLATPPANACQRAAPRCGRGANAPGRGTATSATPEEARP